MGLYLQKIKRISGSKTLIVLSFLAALNPFWVIFAIPFFMIGTIGMFTSRREIREKLLWVLVPLLLWFPCMLGFLTLSSLVKKATAQKVQFVIPANFNGCVSVYFPAPFGQKKKLKEGREIIEVPESGIVFYSGEIEDGYIDWNYRVNNELIEGNRAHHMTFYPSGGGSAQFNAGNNKPMSYNFRHLLVLSNYTNTDEDSLNMVLESRDSIIQQCFIEQKDLINRQPY